MISLQSIIPPVIPDKIITRERLLLKLHENRNTPLILINASAGYGKTVLLADYIIRNPQNFSWLTASTNISGPSNFIEYITKAIRLKHHSFGTDTLQYIKNFTGSWGRNNIIELVTIFLNEIVCSMKAPLTLVIDDFQNLETEGNKSWIEILFSELLTVIAGNFKLIISTRQVPVFKTSRLEAKRQLFILRTDDLRLDLEETSKFTRVIYNETNADTAGKLLTYTSGWITAMHMLMQSDKKLNTHLKFTDNLYSYIAEDIFSALEDNIKSFLSGTAYLDTFDETFTDKLLNIDNSKEIINRLISKNIFLEKSLSETRVNYFYQKLFSEFLRKHVEEFTTKEEQKNIHLKIADTYISEGRQEEALWFLAQAIDVTRFREILMENIDSWFENLDLISIEKWIGWADKLGIIDPFIIYYRLKYLVKSNNIGNFPVETLDVITETEDNELRLNINLLKAEYLLLTANFTDALDILNSLSGKLNTVKTKKQYLQLLCKVYYRSGFEYHNKLVEIGEAAIQFYNDNNIVSEKLEVIGYLANIYSNSWDSMSAIKYHESTLKIEKDIQKIFINLSNLIDLYSESGQYQKAYEVIERSENIYIKYSTPYFQRLLVRSKTKFNNNLGDYRLSLQLWSELQENSSIMNNAMLSWNYYQFYCEIYYFLNASKSGLEYFFLSEKHQFENDYVLIMNNFIKHYYCYADLLTDDTEKAVSKMLKYHIANNLYMVIPQMEYHLAKIHLEKELFTSTENYITLVLQKYRAKKQTTFLESELILSRKLFDFAISHNIEKKFISTIFDAIRNKLTFDFISAEYRAELNARIFKLTDIKFLPFGNTEFYQRGETVPEDKWVRKKSKILLAYLMSDPERVHTKDKIMDMFFDDMPADKADVAYHSAVYNIRTALKIYDIKSDKPKRSKDKTYDYNPQYILYEDKTLRLNPDFYYTAVNIEFEKHYNKTKLPSLTNEEKVTHSVKAIELYKGDFMPGYYDSWCEELRVKYKNIFITVCEELIKLLEHDAKYEKVIMYSEMLLKEDKLNDSAHISIINAYGKLGNINMANSRYQLMLKLYDEELGEKPQSNTCEKIKLILNEVKDL